MISVRFNQARTRLLTTGSPTGMAIAIKSKGPGKIQLFRYDGAAPDIEINPGEFAIHAHLAAIDIAVNGAPYADAEVEV